MIPRLALTVTLGWGCLACSGDDTTVIFVTVRGRDAIRDASQLDVTLTNDGMDGGRVFSLGDDFPLTFSVTPEGRTGTIAIDAEASDDDLLEVATGTTEANIVPGGRVDATLQLEPSDFVVNSMVADAQWLAFREDLVGRQVAVHEDSGRFMVVWENECPLGRCDVLGRLFDADTRPHQDASDVVVNRVSELTTAPSVAAGASGFLAAWLYSAGAGIYHVKALALDLEGTPFTATETILSSSGPAEEAPTVLARPDGGYVVAWERERETPATGHEIVARQLDDHGAPVGPEILVAVEPTLDLRIPHGVGLPASGGFVVTWTEVVSGGLRRIRARVFAATGAPVGSDVVVSPETSGQADQSHVAATSDGFVVGWRYIDSAQRLEVRRFDENGNAFDPPVVVVDPSMDGFSSPSVAFLPGVSTVGVAWHDCGDLGDGMGCGLRLAFFSEDLTPRGAPILLNTTLAADQRGPTLQATGDGFLAVWTDASQAEPDTAETAIRARYVYPP